MKAQINVFHIYLLHRLKWCQKSQEQIKMDILTEQRATKNFGKFWKSTASEHLPAGADTDAEGDARPCGADAARSWSEARTHATDLLF